MHGCCHGQRTRGLDHHLHARCCKAHGFNQLGIAHCHDVIHQGLNHRKGELPNLLGLGPVGNRSGCVDFHDVPQLFALLHIVAGFWFDPDHPAIRAQLLRHYGAAREQPAATQADQQQVQWPCVFKQLDGGRPLTGHHVGMVIGRYQRHATLLCQLPSDRFAVLCVAVIGDHFGTIAACGCHLDGGRVQRHHDRSRNSQQLRRERYALRVIA